MSADLLTSVYLPYPRLTNSSVEQCRASLRNHLNLAPMNEINFTHAHALPDSVLAYVENSLAEGTRRVYQCDLAHFLAWGGAIPASDRMIAQYLADHVGKLSPATMERRLAILSKAHAAMGVASPTGSELVRATLRGIKRSVGAAQVQAKPLMRDDLFALLASAGDDPKSIRDCALLLIGFAGGFRRSELVGLNQGDIEHVRQGVIVHLRRSKTDQLGAGRKIAIPFGRTRWCPVSALDRWLEISSIDADPLFRPINRHGHMSPQRLSGEAVSLIVKERLRKAGIDPTGYSGHSLRAGFATSAAMAGASNWKIRQQTGHRSDAMLARYIRDGDAFVNNAAGLIL